MGRARSHRAALAAAAAWGAVLASALDARRGVRPLDPAARPAGRPAVSVIVPARDEQDGIGAAIVSLLALDWERLQIVVVDDESRDGTWAAAQAAAAGDPRVVLLRGAPLPPGWVGKQWAIQQGLERATGEWLLFADADVRHAPPSLSAALARAEEVGAAGVSALPLVETSGRAERVLTGAAILLVATVIAPAALVRSPRVGVALAAGGHTLVRRDAYLAAGGHAGIRDRMVDDVALAEALKRAGTPLALAPSDGLVRVRMYADTAAAVRGWRKGAAHAVRGHAASAALAAAVLALAAATPPLALAGGLRRRDPRLAALGAAGWGGMAAARLAVGRFVPAPAAEAALAPAGLLALAGIALRSVAERQRRGAVWRGRAYPFAR
jgi:chlorobactene glucosyltransferase